MRLEDDLRRQHFYLTRVLDSARSLAPEFQVLMEPELSMVRETLRAIELAVESPTFDHLEAASRAVARGATPLAALARALHSEIGIA